jgi:hypothetical protein
MGLSRNQLQHHVGLLGWTVKASILMSIAINLAKLLYTGP